MGLAGGKDLRGDGDNRYRSESWIFYMRKDLSFIGPGKALGLDFGPSFPVPAGQSDSRRLWHVRVSQPCVTVLSPNLY